MRRLMFTIFTLFLISMSVIMGIIHVLVSQEVFNRHEARRIIDQCDDVKKVFKEETAGRQKNEDMEVELAKVALLNGYQVFWISEEELRFSSNYYSSIDENVRERLDKELRIEGQNIVVQWKDSAVQEFEKPITEWIKTIDEDTYVVHYWEELKGTFILVAVILDDDNKVILVDRLDDIFQFVKYANRFLVEMVIIFILISVVFFYFLSKVASKNLEVITQKSDEMAHMKFEPIPKIKGPKELQILRKSLNTLSTKLKETIQQLSSANEKLQLELNRKIEMEKVRKQFLSDVSHELKTPVAVVQSYAEALLDGVGDEAYYKHAIFEEICQMDGMISELLELTRLEADKVEYNSEEIDIEILVADQVKRMEQYVVQKGKKIIFHSDLQEQSMINGDRSKIKQVVQNLISNAVKYEMEGKPIEVTLREKAKIIILEFYNTCPPMSAYEVIHIWDRFYKTDQSRHREESGLGLGLAIVKNILEYHQVGYEAEYVNNGLEIRLEFKKINP